MYRYGFNKLSRLNLIIFINIENHISINNSGILYIINIHNINIYLYKLYSFIILVQLIKEYTNILNV